MRDVMSCWEAKSFPSGRLNFRALGLERVSLKRYSCGGFVVDPSVRRFKRPIAGRLIALAMTSSPARGYLRIYENPVVVSLSLTASAMTRRLFKRKVKLIGPVCCMLSENGIMLQENYESCYNVFRM